MPRIFFIAYVNNACIVESAATTRDIIGRLYFWTPNVL